MVTQCADAHSWSQCEVGHMASAIAFEIDSKCAKISTNKPELIITENYFTILIHTRKKAHKWGNSKFKI